MSKTPKWDKWCEIVQEVSAAREKLQKHQKKILNAVQEDMNLPGKDNTERILEEETDLDLMYRTLQPLLNSISEDEL